jgi:SAM-dependent methyltransferase
MIKAFLKKIFKTHTYLNSLVYLFQKLRIRLRLHFSKIETDSGTTHATLSLKDSVHYIESVFEDYQRVSGRAHFKGRVAELGPGDNDGVALMFLANGASDADLADRFYSHRDFENNNKIYAELASRHSGVDSVLKKNESRLKRYYGSDAAGETFFCQHTGYDYIVSRSVLEHVDEPALVIQKMYNALNPGGMLIHKVDLRDHGMFTPFSYALKFLEVPQKLYKFMTYGTGYPNRFLFHRYKDILKALNPKTHFYVAGLHGVPPLDQEYSLDKIPKDLQKKAVAYINKNRHRYSSEFKNVSAEDLMVSSFFFATEKVA